MIIAATTTTDILDILLQLLYYVEHVS